MTAKKEENGDESLYADKTYQVKVNMSRDCITKHIFVGDTRIASRVTFNDLTHSDNEEIRGVYYYHPDHLGNTTFVSDYRGEEYQHLEYTPYGETWVEESDNNKYINYKFTGKELDEETGLYYFGARYYDSKTSVFMSADPIYDGVKEGFGVYTYCRNNPLKYTDPTGLAPREMNGYDIESDWAGRTILAHYLWGKGKTMNINNNYCWSKYMMTNYYLQNGNSSEKSIGVKDIIKDQISGMNAGDTKNINLTVHQNIDNGESIVGYQYLHGTNPQVGDFKIEGVLTMDDNGKVTVDMKYTWNDKIDPNFQYSTDKVKSDYAKKLTGGKAKDYDLSISWNDKSVYDSKTGKFTKGWLSKQLEMKPKIDPKRGKTHKEK